MNFQKFLFKISPLLYRFLIYRGWVIEKKWTGLSSNDFDSYLADNHPDREWFVEWITEKDPYNVLEIGAGGLHEVRQLKARKKIKNYTVLEAAKGFLIKAKKQLPEINFVEGSINCMHFADATFDVVYCRAVLEHQPYYKKAVNEMFRVARSFVVINLFRWSLYKDVIRREKYYSNAYKIDDFLAYIKKLSTKCNHFLILKGKELGQNMYEDENIRRTGDHLVIVATKHPDISLDIYKILHRLRLNYIPHPYQDNK